jgi:hypothetical protein
MKTSNFNLRNLSGSISTLLLIGAAFLTGCQKDELPTATLQPMHSEVARKSSTEFSMLVIEHKSTGNELPIYKVELWSDGLVYFQGIQNTAFIGETKLMVTDEQVQKIYDLYKENEFISMETFPNVDDQQIAVTTFTYGLNEKPETRIDNNEFPERLIGLRLSAEEILGIGELVNKSE